MLVTPHIVTGAAIGSKIINPYLAGALSFISHFILDKLPHWEYYAENAEEKFTQLKLKNKKIVKTFIYITLDSILGLAIIGIAIHFINSLSFNASVVSAILFSILPDIIIVISMLREEKTGFLLKKAKKLHSKNHIPEEKNRNIPLGIITQALITIAAIAFIFI